MKQWHPVFAKLLRPLVEEYFEVQTNVAVGDLPREADLLLLRRKTAGPLPFHGLWKNLTTWNVLEFKGPTVSLRPRNLELLVELGLGIDRRLHERSEKKRWSLEPSEVSFWLLANRIGKRFLREAEWKLTNLQSCGEGVWRGWALRKPVFLVSSVDLPVDYDSLPLHIVGKEPAEKELAVVRFVLAQPALWKTFGGPLASLHSATIKELQAMARTVEKEFKFDMEPLIEYMGMDEVIKQIGLNRVIDQIGLDRVIDQIGDKAFIQRRGLDRFLASLTPAQRRELKRKLQ
jgi:hypothetical protein